VSQLKGETEGNKKIYKKTVEFEFVREELCRVL